MNIVWMDGCTTDCWRKVSIKEIKCNKQKSNRVVKKIISDRDISKLFGNKRCELKEYRDRKIQQRKIEEILKYVVL